MYLRTLRQRPALIRSSLSLRNNITIERAFLSNVARRLQDSTTEKPRPTPRLDQQQDGHAQQARSRSIRPFTVLALFIPLGYALSWATERKNTSSYSQSADSFVRYTLVKKQEVTSTSAIFTLKPITTSSISTNEPGTERAITSVQFKQPQLQIARNYTLLPQSTAGDSQELSFLIRKERNGEVSGYLHRLPLGAEIELRGPVLDYVVPEGVQEVVFLAGGTGIVPALQVTAGLGAQARVHILWANRTRQDCLGGVSDTAVRQGWTSWLSDSFFQSNPPGAKENDTEKSSIVSIIDDYKRQSPDSGRLLVDYYVDEENTLIQREHVKGALRSAQPTSAREVAGGKLLLVSGPEGFINYWAGPKQWIDGREVQGPVGGVLSSLDLTGWEVVKL